LTTHNSNFELLDAKAAGKYQIHSLQDEVRQLPLDAIFASDFGDYEPPEELVEGLIDDCSLSVMFGDSNSGKTFFAIDMACAISRGITWMGRRTTIGLVIYLATESPNSARNRLIAYQKHFGYLLDNFVLVPVPVNFYSSEDDEFKVINLVKKIELQKRQKVRLIIGDTLARISAGANENSGQDMGIVIKRVEEIKEQCQCHFMLIHHTGKNATAGARGWSGLKGAVDTEIEITSTIDGRCAEITKQRDMSTKGKRIGFKLEPVPLGINKWGENTFSCVVLNSDAPPKTSSKRENQVDGAILEFLKTKGTGVKKVEVVNHLEYMSTKPNTYKRIKHMVIDGQLNESTGILSFSTNNLKGAN
jgi:RecA-family ATPase